MENATQQLAALSASDGQGEGQGARAPAEAASSHEGPHTHAEECASSDDSTSADHVPHGGATAGQASGPQDPCPEFLEFEGGAACVCVYLCVRSLRRRPCSCVL